MVFSRKFEELKTVVNVNLYQNSPINGTFGRCGNCVYKRDTWQVWKLCIQTGHLAGVETVYTNGTLGRCGNCVYKRDTWQVWKLCIQTGHLAGVETVYTDRTLGRCGNCVYKRRIITEFDILLHHVIDGPKTLVLIYCS